MLFVQHNLLAENANRQLQISTNKNAKTTEKLSSGYKINRAADDAAGLSISEKMRRQVRGLHQTVSNISEGTGYVQTAEGALNEVHDMLQRMNELAVKSANGTNTEEDRAYIDREVQQLKSEMDRIFETTTFNEQRIWEPREKELLGIIKKQAAEFGGPYSQSIAGSVTNANCDVLARGSYMIHADVTDGVWVTWTGRDGRVPDYETQKISWEELEKSNYSFEMSDYFGERDPAKNPLYTTNANGDVVPQFTHKVSFSVRELATIDDIVACIDGTSMWSSSYATMTNSFEKPDGSSQAYDKVRPSGASLDYFAAYVSRKNDPVNGHNFDKADDAFLEPDLSVQGGKGNLQSRPSATLAADAKTSSEKWVFSFDMAGIGKVTGTSSGLSYYSNDWNDLLPKDKDLWWYEWGPNNEYTDYKTHTASGGTLSDVMSALTGTRDEYNYGKNPTDRTPGLLTTDKDGTARRGGTMTLSFTLMADQEFTYGNNTPSKYVGSFSIRIDVLSTDTEQSVLDRIHAALKEDTIIDLHTTSAGSDSHTIYRADEKPYAIDEPIYGGICGFYVQAGTESGEHIEVKYKSLSTLALGIDKTNTLTVDSSSNAINEIKAALQTVSEQRSTFGAYQNRLEHAQNINANVEENTQAAESLIRDADIADLMMEYSVNNILMQAGTSMLTQANQANQRAVELLG